MEVNCLRTSTGNFLAGLGCGGDTTTAKKDTAKKDTATGTGKDASKDSSSKPDTRKDL